MCLTSYTDPPLSFAYLTKWSRGSYKLVMRAGKESGFGANICSGSDQSFCPVVLHSLRSHISNIMRMLHSTKSLPTVPFPLTWLKTVYLPRCLLPPKTLRLPTNLEEFNLSFKNLHHKGIFVIANGRRLKRRCGDIQCATWEIRWIVFFTLEIRVSIQSL